MPDMIRSSLLDEHQDFASAITLLDQWVNYRVHRMHQPGLALGIVHQGDLIWAKPYGLADVASGTPVTLDTRFRIASISKTFTATAIMQLRDAGQLRLDDPVADYLDWFTLQYADAPPITLRHLLMHVSGLPRDGARSIWESDDFHTWDEVIDLMPEFAPTMPPLQAFSYSNLGYAILGGVVQAVSGQEWADYIQQHILDPLDMHDTLPSAHGGEPNLATGYLREDDAYQRSGMHVVDAKAYDAATGMASTVRDLAKYARFHLGTEENGVLSPHTLRDMHRVHWLYEKWDGGYGLGMGLMRLGDFETSGHGGGYKGFLTGFTLARKEKAAVIILTNAIDSEPFQFTERAFKLVVPELVKIDAKKTEAQPEWRQYVGRYVSDWVNVQVLVHDNQLQVVSIPFPDAPRTTLIPTDDPHTFTIKVPGNPGEMARFEFDDAGSVTRLWLRNEYADRVG